MLTLYVFFPTDQPLTSATRASAPPRTRISKQEMYEANKRVWSQLPEVQAKRLAEKRKSQAETNRLRVKLFQQVKNFILMVEFYWFCKCYFLCVCAHA